jgi:hypothetical protein
MKKRIIICLLIAGCVTAAAFGQETEGGKKPAFRVSLGAGGQLNANFSTWFVDKDIPGDLNRYNSSVLGTSPYLFVDLKYIEFNVGLGIGTIGKFNSANPLSANSNFPARTLSARGGAYLKLPFTLTNTQAAGAFTLYPLLGAEYELFFMALKDDDRDAKFPAGANNQDADPMEALSALSFKLGIGFDVFFTDHLFLRTELLYGLRLPNKMDIYQNDIYTGIESKLFHGGDFKIAAGWRF